MIDKENVKMLLENIREECQRNSDCNVCSFIFSCPSPSKLPSEWTDEEIEEVLK